MKNLLGLLFFLVLISCQAPVDYSLADAEIEYFEDLLPQVGEAWNSGDREPYIKLNENAIYMVPHSKTLSNPSDIRAFAEGFPECKTIYSDFDVRGNDGIVSLRGRFLITDMEDNMMDNGKFLALFERNDTNEWQLTQTIWNSDLAMPTSEGESGSAVE